MPNYTTNLNLLKKDPKTDGNDYFNIQTMLNDNWDKIDAGVAAKETPAGAQAKMDNIAGAGRTTQTIKGNADAIAALNQTVTSHSADNTAHGAVSTAIASKIIVRDANGRAKVASPSAADDIARKDNVDAVQTNLTNHAAVAGSTSTVGHVQLGTGASQAAAGNHSHDGVYATAAQGTLAANAMPKAGGTFTGAVNYGRQVESQPQIKDYSETLVTNAAATGAVTVNIANGNVINLTLTGAVTLTFSNPAPSGQACSFTLKINMPASLYAITWPASVKWDGDTAPTFNVSKTAYITFATVDGGARYHGFSAATNLTT